MSFLLEFISGSSFFRRLAKSIVPFPLRWRIKKILYRKQLEHIQFSLQADQEFVVQGKYSAREFFSLNDGSIKNVRIDGPLHGNDKFSYLNRSLALSLEKQGVTIVARSLEENEDIQSMDLKTPQKSAFTISSASSEDKMLETDLHLKCQWKINGLNMRGKINAFHSYGLEDSICSNHWVEDINKNLDFLSVASKYVAKTLRDNGIVIPIVVTGQGIFFCYDIAKEDSLDSEGHLKRFVFLNISTSFSKNGVDILLRSYGTTFDRDDDVSLIIKIPPDERNEVELLLNKLRNENKRFPHVLVIYDNDFLSKNSRLYAVADFYVAPSRVEEYGIPLANAMAYGVPVIATGYGGHVDYCTRETALLCDYQFSFASNHLSTKSSVWVEPSHESLSALMKEAFLMPSEKKITLVKKAKQNIEKQSWENIANKIISSSYNIKNFKKTFENREKYPIVWVSPWKTRCGIATYSQNLSHTFVDKGLIVFANKENSVSEDDPFVKRVWDPSQNGLRSLLSELEKITPHSLIIQHQTGQFGIDWLFELLLYCHKKGVNSFLFLHNPKEVFFYLNDNKDIIKKIFSAATRLFVHTLSDVNLFRDVGEIGNVTLFPHGVYEDSDPDNKNTPLEASVWKSKKIIASYGFLMPHKGIRELVVAFSFLLKKNKNLHLLLVNAIHSDPKSMAEKRSLDRLIDSLGISSNITLVHDFLSDQQSLSYLKSADLIVYPYQASNESASGAVKMGVASGRPIAVTPLQLFEDLPNDVAYRFSGFSWNEIAEGVDTLLNDKEIQESMTNNMENYRRERDWALLSERLFRIVEGCRTQKLFDGGY
jgi:glycosyltransferase involved in cell wall biosynthesis